MNSSVATTPAAIKTLLSYFESLNFFPLSHMVKVGSLVIYGSWVISGSSDGNILIWNISEQSHFSSLEGHTSSITSFSSQITSTLLISGSSDCKVGIWDMNSSKLITFLEGHSKAVTCVFLTFNAKHIISGSLDRTIRVWDPRSHLLQKVLQGHYFGVTSIDCNDYYDLVSGSIDKTLIVWKIETGQLMYRLSGHTDTIIQAKFTRKSSWFLSISYDKTLRIWDGLSSEKHMIEINCIALCWNSSKLVAGMKNKGITFFDEYMKATRIPTLNEAAALAITRDDQFLVVGSSKAIQIWDFPLQSFKFSLPGHSSPLSYIGLLMPENIAIINDMDSVRIWDASLKKTLFFSEGSLNWGRIVIQNKFFVNANTDIQVFYLPDLSKKITLSIENKPVICVCLSDDGMHLASGHIDNVIRLWDLVGGKMICYYIGNVDRIESVHIIKSKYIVSGNIYGIFQVYNAKNSLKDHTLLYQNQIVTCVVSTSDCKWIISGHWDSSIILWNALDKTIDYKFNGHTDSVTSLALNLEETQIFSCSLDISIKVWSFATRNLLFTLLGHTAAVSHISLAHNDLLVSSSDDNTIRVWDLPSKTSKIIPAESVTCLKITENGKYLISGSKKSIVTIQLLKNTEKKIKLKGHKSMIYCVTSTNDNKFVCSGSFDKTIKVWNLLEKKIEKTLIGHESAVWTMTISKDSKYLISGSWDQSVRIWCLLNFTQLFVLKMQNRTIWCISFWNNEEDLLIATGEFIQITGFHFRIRSLRF